MGSVRRPSPRTMTALSVYWGVCAEAICGGHHRRAATRNPASVGGSVGRLHNKISRTLSRKPHNNHSPPPSYRALEHPGDNHDIMTEPPLFVKNRATLLEYTPYDTDTISFEMPWNPHDVLVKQPPFPQAPRDASRPLSDFVTTVGDLTRAEDVGPLDYAERVWGATGIKVVKAIDDWARIPKGDEYRCKSISSNSSQMMYADSGTVKEDDIQICAVAIGANSLVTVKAQRDAAIVVGEVLCFITGVNLDHTADGCEPELIYPSVRPSSISDFKITCISSRDETASSAGRCWHKMRPVPSAIAQYPISPRPKNEPGLAFSRCQGFRELLLRRQAASNWSMYTTGSHCGDREQYYVAHLRITQLIADILGRVWEVHNDCRRDSSLIKRLRHAGTSWATTRGKII